MDITKELLKKACLHSHMAFTRCFFKYREGSKFIVNPHHEVIASTLDRVFTGEIKRLIINVPPGYTKTEMAVLAFVARGLAINPAAKFIHTSYADSLALQNSITVRDIVLSDEYQDLWPMRLRKDSQSKKAWYNESGGGLLAVASGGTITGFRAGRMVPGFSGAIIIDDPLKPDDAYSDSKRAKVNNRITNTLKSRLAHEDVPIILIMQRLHEDDSTGFLLRGGTGEKWHHLVLPAQIDKQQVYPSEYTHGIEIKHKLPDGPLWPYKHTLDILKVMRDSDPYTTASQYDQRPSPLGGGIIKDDWWQYYDPEVLPQFEYRYITADTAQKIKEHNDYSVFACWGYYDDCVYLLDVVRGRWEADELQKTLEDFAHKHMHGSAPSGRLRSIYIEDKSSGTGLIQTLKKKLPIEAVQRHVDKVTRAMDAVPYIKTGRVLLPEYAHWVSDFKDEVRKFTPLMTHSHDDQVDVLLDGVMLGLMDMEAEAGTF